MNKEHICTSAYGIKAPIIREGDNLADIVVNCVLDATKTETNSISSYDIDDKDIIGVTESVIARSLGLYATIDDIANDVREKFKDSSNGVLVLYNMIYSRNRFAMILRGIARGWQGKKIILYMPQMDEVGNVNKNHPFTNMDYTQYYKDIVEGEGCTCVIHEFSFDEDADHYQNVIYCGLHDYNRFSEKFKSFRHYYTLKDILSDRCDWGVLGSNKATDEKIKLFPNIKPTIEICENIKKQIFEKTKKKVLVCCYGDGSYKDFDSEIWEMADPVPCPGCSDIDIFQQTPNEIKVKAFADDKYKDLNGKELDEAIAKEIGKNKNKNLKGNMISQGTTPRKYINLISSLCDLISGSGQKCTPIVLIKNYF